MQYLQAHALTCQVQAGDVSRRLFVRAGTIAGLSGFFLFNPTSIFAGQQPRGNRDLTYGRHLPDEARRDPVYRLTRSRFTPHLGDQFQVFANNAETVHLKLLEINDLEPYLGAPKAAGARVGRDEERDKELSFSLIFFGFHDMPLGQQTCIFKHYALGELRLLIVPVGIDTHGRYYEIVFNRSDQ